MIYGIYQSAAGLQLNQYRQSVLANNLANASTGGFKHDLTLVRERQVASREDAVRPDWSNRVLDDLTGGSLVAPTWTSFQQGTIETTGRRLDVALDGEGFFTVQDGDAVRYTRDGRFSLNAQGELITAAGQKALDENGAVIVVPAAARSKVSITPDGDVRSPEAVFGRLAIVDFEDKSLLRKVGGNVFEALGAEPNEARATLRSEAVEQSTVDPMKAMVSMIEVNRAYEMNATMIGLADSTLGRAVNDIARLR